MQIRISGYPYHFHTRLVSANNSENKIKMSLWKEAAVLHTLVVCGQQIPKGPDDEHITKQVIYCI